MGSSTSTLASVAPVTDYTIGADGTVSVASAKWQTLSDRQRRRIARLNRKPTAVHRRTILSMLESPPSPPSPPQQVATGGMHGIREDAVQLVRMYMASNDAPGTQHTASAAKDVSDFKHKVAELVRQDSSRVNRFIEEARRRIARDGGVTNAIRIALKEGKDILERSAEDKKEYDRRAVLLAKFNEASPRKIVSATLGSDTGFLVIADCAVLRGQAIYGEARGAAWEAAYDNLAYGLHRDKRSWNAPDFRSAVFSGGRDGYHICTVTDCEGKDNHGQMNRYFEIELKAYRFPPKDKINSKNQVIVKFNSGYLLVCDPLELENRYGFGRANPISMGPSDLVLRDLEQSSPRRCSFRPSASVDGAVFYGLPRAGAYDLVIRQKQDGNGYPYEVLCCETNPRFFLTEGLVLPPPRTNE